MAEPQAAWTVPLAPTLDVEALADRLDRRDVLLLREFYYTGRDVPNDTRSHVLRLLADRLGRSAGPLAGLSYAAIRYRLENLVALGLIGRIRRTNPAVYYPHDALAPQVRRVIARFAAELVGLGRNVEGARP